MRHEPHLKLASNGFGIALQVASEGVCFPGDSSLDAAMLVVPMRTATASWVRPALARALSISSIAPEYVEPKNGS